MAKYLLCISCLTWKQSVQSYERFAAKVPRTTWTTSTWTPLYGAYSWIPHSEQQSILVETRWRIYYLPRISPWSLRNTCSKRSRIRQKSMLWPRLITKTLPGDRQVYYVTKLLRLRKPKPTSSPTLCYVWGVRKMNRTMLGRTKLNGISRRIIWKISMESRRRSSGNYSQDSQRWASSKRFKNFMKDLQCFKDKMIFMSMYGRSKRKKNVKIIHALFRIMLADFISVVGHSWD